MKKRVKYIQKSLFGDDEMRSVIVSKPIEYDENMTCMVSMLHLVFRAYGLQNYRHLPRIYSIALVNAIKKDRSILQHLLAGNKIRYKVSRDDFGNIKNVEAFKK